MLQYVIRMLPRIIPNRTSQALTSKLECTTNINASNNPKFKVF